MIEPKFIPISVHTGSIIRFRQLATPPHNSLQLNQLQMIILLYLPNLYLHTLTYTHLQPPFSTVQVYTIYTLFSIVVLVQYADLEWVFGVVDVDGVVSEGCVGGALGTGGFILVLMLMLMLVLMLLMG